MKANTHMNEQQARDWWLEHLQRTLGETNQRQLMVYLQAHPDLKKELEEEEAFLMSLEQIQPPHPSPKMDLTFQAMMVGYKVASKQSPSWTDTIFEWISPKWKVAIPSMALGVLMAWLFIPRESGKEIARLSDDLAEMKKMMILTMIEQPKAQDRIAAVSMVSEVTQGDERIIEVLVQTLNSDKSLNVRLAALDALLSFGHLPEVRTALIQSIGLQESPLLQVALADAMVQLRNKESVDAFQELMDSSNLEETVKSKLQSTIKLLKEI